MWVWLTHCSSPLPLLAQVMPLFLNLSMVVYKDPEAKKVESSVGMCGKVWAAGGAWWCTRTGGEEGVGENVGRGKCGEV